MGSDLAAARSGLSVLPRRGLLTGIIALCAAPAIVRAGSIMPVKVMPASLGEMLDQIDVDEFAEQAAIAYVGTVEGWMTDFGPIDVVVNRHRFDRGRDGIYRPAAGADRT